MVMIRCKVIGPNEVAGAQPGEEVMIDDDLINVAALEDGGHVEILGADDPEKPEEAGQHTQTEPAPPEAVVPAVTSETDANPATAPAQGGVSASGTPQAASE